MDSDIHPMLANPTNAVDANVSKTDNPFDSDDIEWVRVEDEPNTNEDDNTDDIQWIRVEDNGEDLDLNEYEKKMHEHAEETRNLLSDLCQRTDLLAEQQREAHLKLEKEKELREKAANDMAKVSDLHSALNVKQKELEDRVDSIRNSNNLYADETAPRIEWNNIDSIRVGQGVLQEPTSAHVLPNLTVFIVDRQCGLFLFSLNSVLLRRVTDANWKWPEAATCDSTNIYVSLMLRTDEYSPWKRHILKLDHNLNFLSKIEGPKWIAEETVTVERLCIASNGYIYMSVDGEYFTALYELSTDAKWTELTFKKKQAFIDVQVLAFIDPIIELLVVEKQSGYVYMFSIGRSNIFARRVMSVVERPIALTVDDRGQLFVADMAQAKVKQLDTRIAFQPLRDIALLEHPPYVISANKGFLTVTYRQNNIVRIHKYTNVK